MDETLNQITNLLPTKWKNTLLIAVLLSPYVVRGFRALMNGGGLKGVFSAIWGGIHPPSK